MYRTKYKCSTCGAEILLLTPQGKKKEITCTNCWEIERRIDDYLKSENGRKFIKEKLKIYGK